ncbi:YdcF family protein [Larkinella terrae]|uniref:YdcF family protein n=1 Tax=Larkinella terrae TaxID=2025311 RepID=A0A7K0EEF4_9BACT|nr:YdcF family protein [Larkinella terrae]MRS59838.1 YdcF family protein [Larkinella terrae]
MFYFLSKVLSFLIMPLGLVTIALLLAVFTKNHARRRKALISAVVLLLVTGNGFITNELAIFWEYPPANLPARTGARIGVVLTGGLVAVDAQPRNHIYLGSQADRMGQALLLYKSGQIQKILISGGTGGIIKREVAEEGQLARQFLLTAGVPAQDVVLENRSRNTHENALFSAPILQKQFKAYQCVLITSAWHMRRAVGCFQKQNLAVIPYPTSFISAARDFTPNSLLLPSEKALFDFYWLFHEFIGYVAYWVTGYV